MVVANEYSILITDDDVRSRETLREIITPLGYSTLLAASGEEAIDLLSVRPVHLLLCDVQMPRLNGLETVELARRVNGTLPCILVTAESGPELLQQAFRRRVYSVIAKPVSRHELVYTVRRALQRTYRLHEGDDLS